LDGGAGGNGLESGRSWTIWKRGKDAVLGRLNGLAPEVCFSSVPNTFTGKTGFEQGNFMAKHMWCHSERFNFIQTLLGDFESH